MQKLFYGFLFPVLVALTNVLNQAKYLQYLRKQKHAGLDTEL